MKLNLFRHGLALTLALSALALPAIAGPDDDARFQGNGTTRNSVEPTVGGSYFADFPTNVEPNTGTRIMPPTNTSLIAGQRFDLRVESQVPGTTPPTLKSLTVNGTDITASFLAKITTQGTGLESGTPSSNLLYGATARNLTFTAPGIYTVTAVVTINGVDRTITNTYPVASYAFNGSVKRVAFFLGDAMGLPVRTAARIASKGVFEGFSKGKLNMDSMDEYALVYTASYDSIITDSAPGMANYVTGMKQPNNGLNVSADNTPELTLDNPRIETLWQFLKRTQGWKIGVVTDAFVTDATPAAVASHTRSRGTRTAIAQQMLDYFVDQGPSGPAAQPLTGYTTLRDLTQPLDVILGGGAVDWLPRNDSRLASFYQYSGSVGRSDGINLFDIATQNGYTVVQNLAQLNSAPDNKPVLGIFSGEFRTTSSGLGADNIPGALDRLVARGTATIGGKDATAPEIGMTSAPPFGTQCGATIKDCFTSVPSKVEMVNKAVFVLNTLAGPTGGWALLIEQSQSDKLAHPLEYERVIYEAIELDNALGYILKRVAPPGGTLTLVTADHAQPETIIGAVSPGAITAGTTPVGGCFTPSTTYPITLGGTGTVPCALQDVVATFNDAAAPTYVDANQDGFPDDPDPLVKLVIEDGGRPTYSQDYLTNFQPLNPSGSNAAFPNPARDPNGILLTGNMPTKNVTGSLNKTNGNTTVAPHSGDDVPLSASGPGSDLFGGTYDNTDVSVRIAAALSGKTTRSQILNQSPYTNVPFLQPTGTSLTGF